MAAVDTLEIEISASSEKAAEALDKLAGAMQRLKDALPKSNTKGFENLTKNLKSLSDTAKSMEGSIGALAKAANAIDRLSNIKGIRIPKSIGDGIRNIGTAAESVTPEAVENLDRMTRALQRLQNLKMRDAASSLRSAGKGVRSFGESTEVEEESKTRGVAATLGRLKDRIKLNIDTGALKSVGQLAKQAWGHLKRLGQRVRLRIEAATIGKVRDALKGMETVLRSLGRIAFYRAIRSAIKAVTEAFMVGLEWAKKYSDTLTDAVDRRISTAMDGLNVSANKMKLQLGAAFGSLITALAPIINTLIGLITSLATALTQLFAAFTGGTFLKAKDVSGDLAKNMKAGGGAAKEWKNQLMGFDVINRLEDQNGGGGGGGGGLNANDMFEVVQIDQAIKDFVDSLKTAFLNGDWEGVGTLLGEKVNSIFDSIDWAGIGEKIGYWVNGVIQSLYYFLKTVDFVAIGKDVGKLINNALMQIDFTILGRTLIRKFTATIEFFAGMLKEVSWSLVAIKISNFLKGALDEATEWLGSWDWIKIGNTIRDKIIAFLDGLDSVGVALAINRFISRAIEAAKDLFTGLGLKDIVSKISEELSGFLDALSPSSKYVILAILGIGLISGAFSALKGAIDGVKLIIEALPILKFLAGVALIVGGILKVKDGLDEWTKAGELTNESLGKIIEGVGLVAIGIGIFTSPWLALAGVIALAVGAVIEHWDELVEWWHNTDLYQSISATWEDIKKAFADGKTELTQDWESIRSAISTKIDSIKKKFEEFKKKWDEKMEPLRQAAENFQASWSNAFAGVKNAIQGVITWLGSLILRIKSAIEWLATLFSMGNSLDYGDVYNNPELWGSNFASGGFVQEGQLFLAREAGPELVGTIGGRTAVANNDQIVEGISQGVYGAVLAAMSNGGGGSNQPITIYLDGREIARSTTKYQNQMARAGAY